LDSWKYERNASIPFALRSIICIFAPMKKRSLTIILCLLSLLTGKTQFVIAAVNTLPWEQNLMMRLDSLMQDSLLQRSVAGVMVWDLTADSALYCHDHRLTLRPASTMKLLTAITALELLGPEHQLRTSLYFKGKVSSRVLRGDLYCVGRMDPLFSQTDMDVFAEAVQTSGIDTIRGSIVADVSMKDTLQFGEGWCWDDDNPVLSPLLVNREADFCEQLAAALTNRGIVLDSVTFVGGRCDTAAIPICMRHHTVAELLKDMMKESDNLYAEALFYQLPTISGISPATAKEARKQVRGMLTRAGLEPARYRIADGSGLSLYNYVSAEALTMLLRYAWQQHYIYDALLPSLPVAGIDGTLEKRMQKTVAEGKIYAKTGTVSGVSSLAGYTTAANGHRLCFAIINQGVMRAANARDFQDKICQVLCLP